MRQASLPPLVEMRVAGQNRRVGMRNIHRISPGGSRSVGGGFSSYIVFLVRVPGAIGRLANVDGRYVFTPLRHDMFSAVPGPVEDCLGAGIPFTAPNGRQYTLTFDRWVSPLEEINRILGQTRARD
jgi:hypothetical protein